ncbi:hypothetical protein WH96_07195 [Kiloniella spongiae]|uniref:Uncharacterized protein n=1 Tax=Kiloniella spongiae TaxID=1489064 RepID=A0A0H2MFY0_9PROT|nr:hypothetical protein [Kiloniella spongiae]KLN61409.1 hypothetical protein WH96_07195 [Kiloniella spongiae]
MRKYVEILNKQAQDLLSSCEQKSGDDLKAIKRIKWIASSFAAKETENTILHKGDVNQIKEGIRNQKFDADEKLYRQLMSENESCLRKVSPHSLVRYVSLLESPE